MKFSDVSLQGLGKFLDKYYYILIGIVCFIYAVITFLINDNQYNKTFIVLLTFAVFTCAKDIRRDIKWKSYIIIAAPVCLFFLFVSNFGFKSNFQQDTFQ